jgi:hypothetical protein
MGGPETGKHLMGILSKTGDLVYTLRFLRLLTTNFEDTTAFKLGLIDKEGKKLKKAETSDEKSAYNSFHRMVFNLKKLLAKVPGGSSKLASYASALFLIKETLTLSDSSVEKINEACALDPLESLTEGSQWFCAKDGMLSPGIYSLANPKMVNSTCEEICKAGDKIRVAPDAYPVDNILGQDIFEAVHIPTNQEVYVAVGELRR